MRYPVLPASAVPGKVAVIGIDDDVSPPSVYLYIDNVRTDYPHDPLEGNVLWTVARVADALFAVGGITICHSSTVRFRPDDHRICTVVEAHSAEDCNGRHIR